VFGFENLLCAKCFGNFFKNYNVDLYFWCLRHFITLVSDALRMVSKAIENPLDKKALDSMYASVEVTMTLGT
jgi:hypothetical protein